MKGKPWKGLSPDAGHSGLGATLHPARSPQGPWKECLLRLDGASMDESRRLEWALEVPFRVLVNQICSRKLTSFSPSAVFGQSVQAATWWMRWQTENITPANSVSMIANPSIFFFSSLFVLGPKDQREKKKKNFLFLKIYLTCKLTNSDSKDQWNFILHANFSFKLKEL